MTFKRFSKKVGYSVTQNRVKRGGWLWAIWWKRSGKYLPFPDQCGHEETEGRAKSQVVACLVELEAFVCRPHIDEPFIRAVAYGRADGVPDRKAVSKLMARRRARQIGMQYPEMDLPKFQKYHEDIIRLVELEAINPNEYWGEIRARYQPEVEKWKKWDETEGAKQRAWAAEMEEAEATWMNATAEWRSIHRAAYYAKWGEYNTRYWDIGIEIKKRQEKNETKHGQQTNESAEAWFFRFRQQYQREQAHTFNSTMMTTGNLQGALQRFGMTEPDEAEARKTYRKLAMKVHPDTGGSHEAFVQLQSDLGVVLAACASAA
jgi:hypothetical protein